MMEQPVLAPTGPASRSFARATTDLRDGFVARELWAHLGWQDIKQRYRRSVIGPLWITISMGVTAVGLGVLYAVLFGNPIATFLPYVTVGFIVWGFINGCLTEGMMTFIANEGLIKHLPAPLTVYALRTVWRQILMLGHNMVIYLVVLGVFFSSLDKPYTLSGKACGVPDAGICHPGFGWGALAGIGGFALLTINGVWLTLVLGIISTRYRDIPQVINSFIQLLFYLTPIVWSPDTFLAKPGRGWARTLFELNPLYHFVQVMRGPLIGQHVDWYSWVIVGAITVLGSALALVAMRNYRGRVSYWV
jgi:ABC-2 type transport system permease protein